MPDTHDLIVLGAGPAGSAAACVAAHAGLRVALVDRSAFPRDKLCGGGVTGRAIKATVAAFGAVPNEVAMLSRGEVAFHAFGTPLAVMRNVPPLHLTMRRDLDAALVARAIRAGAEDLTGRPAQIDALDPPCLSLGDRRISAPLLIGADGVNSRVAAMLFGRAFDPERIGFALEVELQVSAADAALRIDFGAADWGYGWQFPKPSGLTVGVGGVLRRNADLKARLAQYLATLGLPATAKVKGQYLPFGDWRRVPGRGRALLAGDAAGLVDPISGEGIAHAIQSGHLAAEAALSALSDGAPDAALGRYRRALAPLHGNLRQAGWLRPLLFQPAFRTAFVRGFRGSDRLRRHYMDVIAGEADYGAVTRQALWRLPRFALRSLSR